MPHARRSIHRILTGACAALLVSSVAVGQQVAVTASANERLLQPGPEQRAIAARAGLWDVTETIWEKPGAAPTVTRGLVAERVMIGAALQEFLRSPSDTAHRAVARTDLLAFDRIEGRWSYVSFDTRVPIGLMHAWSPGRESVTAGTASIALTFAPFAVPGGGAEPSGQLLSMDQTVRYDDADHDVKDQFFMLADGTATRWLAHRYAYVRRRD